jgi:hypothetical protein
VITLSVASPTPVMVRVVTSGPNWPTFLLGLLGSLLVGVVTASLIQLYVVPRVETRKRREDRWERWVLELGELLTGSVADHAADLHAAQLVYRDARDRKETGMYPLRRDAEQANFAYGSLINTQVDWLVERVVSISPNAREIVQFQKAWWNYEMATVLVRPLPGDDTSTDEQFDKAWKVDRDSRKELIAEVKVLATLPHPPTRSRWSRRLKLQTR